MTGILAVAVVSAVAGSATWLLTVLLSQALPSGFSILYILPFLTAPLIGGFAGGLVSRRFIGLVGSLAGCAVPLPVLAVVVLGWTLSINGLLQTAVVVGVMGTAGHLSALAIRPTRIGSSVTP